ncbi:single-stranded DNA-binding protein [Aureibaculum algae]|uniref:Single-stranded DNA-binding protein n=1 Tax=Aureibaculum algae TaxID=2584122 RepID=A0A5B7TMM8_9FLAO|nr:single-stranded DNA-binding protein [Aureibaculum algae]QCX37430.1 single-stranded DNA-binding protein [Aureibaculum algae]
MSTIKNHVQLIGNVGQKPIITNLENDKKVARLSLATNENYKNNKGEKQTDTNWHSIVAWGKIEGIIEEFVYQGKKIGIAGKLKTRNYESKGGEKQYVTEIIVNEILLLKGNSNK